MNTKLPEYQQFQQKYEVVPYVITSKEQVIADFNGKLKNIEAIYGAWLGFVPLGGFTGEVLESAPASLKVISICSVGHDNYDGASMAKRGIVLTNVPSDGAAGPVADLVLYNTLAAFRNFAMYALFPENNHTVKLRTQLDSREFNSEVGAPVRDEKPGYSFGHFVGGRPCSNPRDHHVVIVGFGNIGRTIGSRLALIGMHIHYVKRTPLSSDEEAALGYRATFHATLEDTYEFADLVVIACPLTPQTHHLVDAKTIAGMSKPFRIINIGRGPVIDEQALVDGLKSGKVLFAGLDVFENEPTAHLELFGRQDVILTPHVGASTVENFDYTAVCAMQNIDNVLEGKEAISQVN